MLGPSFFDFAQQLTAATRFTRIVELLEAGLASLTQSHEIMVLELDAGGRTVAVHGQGPRAEKWRALADVKDSPNTGAFWQQRGSNSLGFAVSDISAEQSVNFRKCLNTQLGKNWGSDMLGGQLVLSDLRSARLLAFRNDGFYQQVERDIFDVILLIARTALERVYLSNSDRKVRERVLMARHESLIAIFTISASGLAVPINPGGVQCVDAWWNADETDFQLRGEGMKSFRAAMAMGWKNPVSPQWVRVEMDLGGGLMEMTVLPQQPGSEGIVMFSPLTRPSPVTTGSSVPMLTRRQCDIMEWIAEGKTSSEVATILSISPRTVEKHLEAVFQRFGVENRVGAVRRYLELKGS